MPPLNPFLNAFFRSPLPAQCAQTHQYILLVPTTEILLTHHEDDTGATAQEILLSEEFMASHVLRIPSAIGLSTNGAGPPEPVPNLREMRGKAKQYHTVNNRSVVVKDGFIYSNKGFRSPNEAQLIHDTLWYSDTVDSKQWLIYYISKPLIGSWVEDVIIPAVPPAARKSPADQSLMSPAESSDRSVSGRKKEIKFFHELLNHFPVIARHMQPGLERLFRDFTIAFERPLPPPPSAPDIPDPEPDGPVAAAIKRIRSNGIPRGGASSDSAIDVSLPVAEDFFAEDDKDVMRATLESAITAAIDIFQGVDKQQLSMLGATTDLTGSVVERLIERYVTENVHHLLFPKLCALKRPSDLELEAKIRQMEHIDISQLGIVIHGASKAKHELIIQLGLAIEEFRKMSGAMSPQAMLALLISTMKTVTKVAESRGDEITPQSDASSEKPVLTVNADTLVSLLLFVVIRAQVRNLQARLNYIRNFIFIEDIDTGEAGYAVSTFEAVLTYLALDSSGLRKASRRNKALWDAACKGQLEELRKIMEPGSDAIEDEEEEEEYGPHFRSSSRSSRRPSASWGTSNGPSRRSSLGLTLSERFSQGSGLGHVFPFEEEDEEPHENPVVHFSDQFFSKRLKKVALDTRSMSSSSEISFRSRATSFGTINSALEGDVSVERLAHTHNSFGESIVMMAIQHEHPAILHYLLSLSQHFPPPVILEDINNEDTTLLSAAIQMGNRDITRTMLRFIMSSTPFDQLAKYFALQDIWGRSLGHYLFHTPYLIPEVGNLVPWRQRDKNGQTPLFALCRSYDQDNYSSMVAAGLQAAQLSQGDGEPLHVDDHVDCKGNTLLHIVTDPMLMLHILERCDVDVNATNDRRFTPLMLASKYGRYDLVRMLVGDARADLAARELRGLTAVELAKDDDVRNKIDDLALFSMAPGPNGRITGVVRAFFVEDGTVRLVLKSAAPTPDGNNFTVTTCRRSLGDFEALADLLALESPPSWIPSVKLARSPFQIASKPSRAMLRDVQTRADWFMRIMLEHPTFATHETLWEFFLVPEVRMDMMTKRARLKAEALAERIREEMEPVEDVREVEQFVDHAREMVRSVNHSTKSVTRRTNRLCCTAADLHDASKLLRRAVSTLEFLPKPYKTALDVFTRSLELTQSNPYATLHTALLAQQNTITALLSALSRPPALISRIRAAQKTMERSHSALASSRGGAGRWGLPPLGALLADDAKQKAAAEERAEKARRSRQAVDELGGELRHAQQVVASELAGWQDMRREMGRRAVRDFARGMVVAEKVRLDGLMRALRRVREGREDKG